MALTRAMLLQGNSSQGLVLPGQPQGVTAGTGVTIAPSGALSINTLDPAFNAFIRTNSLTAYNAYVWPNVVGAAGTQLTSDGAGNLFWSDSDGIPWTAKGQLIVGTGINTDIILNAGADTAVLMADATTASGLTYSNLSTAAIQVPAGTTLQQPATPVLGQLRYNTDNDEFEGYLGAPPAWAPIGGALPWTALGQLIVGTGVDTDAILNVGADTAFLVADSTNGAYGLTYTDTLTTAALLPAGTTAQRPTPVAGQIRYNSDNDAFEAYGQNATAWEALMPTGPVTDKTIYLNEQTITADYTLPATPIVKNGLSAGPITIAAGFTVTIPAGQSWSIV